VPEIKKPLIEFDPKINAGHVLTLIILVVAAVGFFRSAEVKISEVERNAALRSAEVRRVSDLGDERLQGKVDKTTVILEDLMRRVEKVEDRD
jgi:hypothetical protein